MARKRKNCDKKQNWKPMAIECEEGLNAEDFDGLVALEELKNYQIEASHNSAESKSPRRKKKKRPTKSKLNVEDLLEMVEAHPEPEVDMSAWQALAVPDHIVKCLRDQKIFRPTAIQEATIPAALVAGLDIYGAAPTGSGKTLAFAIPVVARVVQDKENDDDDHLRAIILTPTRELAVQIKNHVVNICRYNGVKVALVVGGLAVQKQQRVLARKRPDIVVATPGRLWDMISEGTVPYLGRTEVARIRYLVIDEADRMVEKAHFQELRFIIDLLNQDDEEGSRRRRRRQVFIFSATLTMVRKTEKSKKKKFEEDPEENLIKLLRLDRNSLKICDLTEGGLKSKPGAEQLHESVVHCLKEEKDLYLYHFVTANPGKTILVFCNSIDCIRRLLNVFRFLQLQPLALHSSMPQKRRLTNVERFTSSGCRLLFATDVAARGLDIPGVDHVVHYQVPRTADVYVHRTGRTARIFRQGHCLILCDPKEEAFFLRDFFRIVNKETLAMEPTPDSRILKRLKERLQMAHLCDQLEHRLRKETAKEMWFKATADSCEIYDSDQQDDDGEIDGRLRERKILERKLKVCRTQLGTLLRKPISVPKQM